MIRLHLTSGETRLFDNMIDLIDFVIWRMGRE